MLARPPRLLIHFICFFAAYTLFSAGDDETVKQWELESNSCIFTMQGHSSRVLCLAVTVDGNWLLSGGSNGSVLLWDIGTGQQQAKGPLSVTAHSGCVSCLAVTPDGSSFVSGSFDRSLKLWHFEALQQPVIQFSGHALDVNACVVSSDGSRLYSGSDDNSIRVWDMTTGQQLASMSHTSKVTSLALRGSLLVSGSYDQTVNLWHTESMQLLHTLPGHFYAVHCVAVSSDVCQRVLSGGCVSRYGDHFNVRVWDAASGAQLAVLQGHSNPVVCITLSSDGRFAASASKGTICVWDLSSLSLIARLEGPNKAWVRSVLFV